MELLQRDSDHSRSDEEEELLAKRAYPVDQNLQQKAPSTPADLRMELMEKNQIKLPRGFFDKGGDEEEFRKAELGRMKRLLKKEGVDQVYTNQQDLAMIEEIQKTLDGLEVQPEEVTDSKGQIDAKPDGLQQRDIARDLIKGEQEEQILSV